MDKETHNVTWYYGMLVLRPTAIAKITIPELTRWDKFKIAIYSFFSALTLVLGILFLIAMGPKAMSTALFAFIVTLTLGLKR